jgi:hypothetical protein
MDEINGPYDVNLGTSNVKYNIKDYLSTTVYSQLAAQNLGFSAKYSPFNRLNASITLKTA